MCTVMLVRFYDDYFPHLTFLFGSFLYFRFGEEKKALRDNRSEGTTGIKILFQSGISYDVMFASAIKKNITRRFSGRPNTNFHNRRV